MRQPAFGTYAPSFWVKFLLSLSQNTVLGRGKARRAIAGMLKEAHAGPLDAHLWGQPARIHVGANNNELKALLNPDSFNRAELDVMRTHLPRDGGVFAYICAEAGLTRIDVLKVDVEGYEDQALLPLFETGPETLWPHVAIMEHCHSGRWARDVVVEIKARGYRELRRDRQNVCLQREVP
jgi:hypothetical protein